MPDSLQALIFDVDGTLSETERDGHRVAFNQTFAEADLDWHWGVERYGALLQVTGGKERIRRYLQEDHSQQLLDPAIDTRIAALHRQKTNRYLALLQTGAIPLRPGVRRLLLEAREHGLRLAIATTTSPENVEGLLRVTLGAESLSWFEVIAAGDVVPRKKPAPDIYEKVLADLQLPAHACLALEDSGLGVRSARGAGLPVVVTTNPYSQGQDFAGAVAIVDGLGEPEQPVHVLHGCPTIAGHVTLADLERWWQEGRQAEAAAG